ncbi:MAG: helix-turn-helix transcriptional regulator [Gemmatimonadota bacterium]
MMGKRRKIKGLQRSFGLRIRSLRRAQGWSQIELGERAGLDHTYIGGIERGERNPSLDAIQKLADGLGIDLGELFQYAAKGVATDTSTMELLAILQGQDPNTIEHALALVQVLVDYKARK